MYMNVVYYTSVVNLWILASVVLQSVVEDIRAWIAHYLVL